MNSFLLAYSDTNRRWSNKMKKNVFYILLMIFICNAFAENFLGEKYFHTDEYGYIVINNDNLTFEDCIEYGQFEHKEKYDVFNLKDSRYIVLSYENEDAGFITLVKEPLRNVLSNSKYACVDCTYSKNFSKSLSTAPKLVGFKVLNSDSYITEKDKSGNETVFLPTPWFNINCNPWAISKIDKDSAIYLTDDRYCVPGKKYADIDEIVIINGFVNPQKMYLYEENARAKNIRISYNENNFVVTLKDTGNYQSIKLPEKIVRNKGTIIKIEILDSYAGSKYSDIVMSGVLYIDVALK